MIFNNNKTYIPRLPYEKPMSENDLKKTTISFPVNVLGGLRRYIGKHGFTTHDQSRIVAIALKEFLERDGIEIDFSDQKMIEFEVLIKSKLSVYE